MRLDHRPVWLLVKREEVRVDVGIDVEFEYTESPLELHEMTFEKRSATDFHRLHDRERVQHLVDDALETLLRNQPSGSANAQEQRVGLAPLLRFGEGEVEPGVRCEGEHDLLLGAQELILLVLRAWPDRTGDFQGERDAEFAAGRCNGHKW